MAYINRAYARAEGSRDTQFTVFLNCHSSWLYSRYEEKNSILGRTIYRHLRADVCKYRPEVGKTKFLKNPKKIM